MTFRSVRKRLTNCAVSQKKMLGQYILTSGRSSWNWYLLDGRHQKVEAMARMFQLCKPG